MFVTPNEVLPSEYSILNSTRTCLHLEQSVAICTVESEVYAFFRKSS
jgi:hypothetical protein